MMKLAKYHRIHAHLVRSGAGNEIYALAAILTAKRGNKQTMHWIRSMCQARIRRRVKLMFPSEERQP